MATYAQVANDIVVNIVLADAEWIAGQPGQWIKCDGTNPFGIGWKVVNGVCVIPPPPAPPVIPE